MQTEMTLVYPIDSRVRRVLLGHKKLRIGAGTYVGFGGRVEQDETIEEAAIRELRDECGLVATVQQLWPVGRLLIHNPCYAAELGDLLVHVFTISEWEGVPCESDEMTPQWFLLSQLPWDRMRESEQYWLPAAVNGRSVEVEIWYDDQEQLITLTTTISKAPPAL